MYRILAQLTPEHRRFAGSGSWRNGVQEVDTTEDQDTAEYLVKEYQLAYGSTWTVWCQEES